MAFVPIPNVVEIRVQQTWNGQQCENVFHFDMLEPPTQASMTALAEAVRNFWDGAQMKATQSGTVARNRVIVRDLSSENGQSVEATFTSSQGSRTSTTLPNNCTVAVKWGTGLAGKSYRGRTYHVGLTDDTRTFNSLTSSFQEQLRAAYDAFRTVLDSFAAGGEFCVASRYTNNAPRPTGICTPISGVSVEATLDSQRRRLPGRGV